MTDTDAADLMREQFEAWFEREYGDSFNNSTKALEMAFKEVGRRARMDCAATLAAPIPRNPVGEWISVDERLPEPGVTVLVYSPPTPDDWPDSVRINFDAIDPDSDDAYWIGHGEHFEHYMAVGGAGACGPDVSCTGPSEKAPYTHWAPLPAPPALREQGADHD